VVKGAVTRGAALINQIMTFARGISGERISVDLKLFVKELSRLLRSTFPKNVRIEFDFPAGMHSALAHPTHLHQVLLNLCVNARDAMPDGGALTISASECFLARNPATQEPLAVAGPFIMLCVADTGVGIPEESREKIFEPFYTTKKAGEGTGLGLATVRSIMRGHSGFVTVKSAMGKGSEFRVFLPAAEEEAPVERGKRIEAPRGSQQLILLVEDEVSIAELSRVTLEAHNYRVLTVHNAEEALRIAELEAKDLRLVIADWQLPMKSGFDLMRDLRAKNPALNAICTTGSGQPCDRDAAGVSYILRKPYGTQDLLQAVAATLA
jgi:CheY-like chemotaxis protein